MAEIQDFRLTPGDSALLVVDVQEKLMAAMESGVRERTISSIRVLIETANRCPQAREAIEALLD